MAGTEAKSCGVMDRWVSLVLRFKLVVLVLWTGLLLGGAVAAMQLPGLLSNSLSTPGTESDVADTILAHHFGENPNGTFTVVLPLTRHAPPRLVQRELRRVVHSFPEARLENV